MKFSEWFTASRRQAIQALALVIITGLQSYGFLTAEQGSAITNLVAGILSFAVAILALINLDKTQAATWFITSLRGTIYSLAALVAVVFVAFGAASDSQVTAILGIISMILTAVQVLVAVVNAPEKVTEAVSS